MPAGGWARVARLCWKWRDGRRPHGSHVTVLILGLVLCPRLARCSLGVVPGDALDIVTVPIDPHNLGIPLPGLRDKRLAPNTTYVQPQSAESQEMRAACKAMPGFSVDEQFAQCKDELCVRCEPPGGGPPCILDRFFHYPGPAGLSLTNHHVPSFFKQCFLRKHDRDWPTVELYAPRTLHTKTISDVARLLAGRRVTIIGASLAVQLVSAIHCAIASSGLWREQSAKWAHWGWSTLAHDNKQPCGTNSTSRALQTEGCVHARGAFDAMLERSDVVIAAWNPAHYGMNAKGTLNDATMWERDQRLVARKLGRWMLEKPSVRLGIFREPAATAFEGGSYQPGVEGDLNRCCSPPLPKYAHFNAMYHALQLQRKARDEEMALLGIDASALPILPLYNETLKRWDMHGADMCSFRTRRTRRSALPSNLRSAVGALPQRTGDGNPRNWVLGRQRSTEGERQHRRRLRAQDRSTWPAGIKRVCCDCVHFCYTPAFYDVTFFTPLFDLLEQQAARFGRPRS